MKTRAASSGPCSGAAGRKARCPPKARATSPRSPPAGASRSSCTATARSRPPAPATTARSDTEGAKRAGNRARATSRSAGCSEVKAISSGAEYSLALLDNGNVEAWGNNGYGTLGNGTGGFEKETGENQLVPKEVRALNGAGVTAIASGGGANFAVLPGGKVMAWGHNNRGQLGIAWPESCEKRKTCEPTAKKPSEEPGKKEAEHLCWTEVGPEQCSKLPKPVTEGEGASERELEHVVQISASSESAYALLEDGEVLSWGNDGKGQLGQTLEPGAHTAFTRPGRVMVSETEPLQHVVAISSNANHALALLEGGRVVGWGDAANGSLGEAAGTCGHEHKSGGGTWPCDRYATPITALERHPRDPGRRRQRVRRRARQRRPGLHGRHEHLRRARDRAEVRKRRRRNGLPERLLQPHVDARPGPRRRAGDLRRAQRRDRASSAPAPHRCCRSCRPKRARARSSCSGGCRARKSPNRVSQRVWEHSERHRSGRRRIRRRRVRSRRSRRSRRTAGQHDAAASCG